MSLHILDAYHSPTAADLLRFFLRTEVRWLEHLAEPAALDVGTAYANGELPDVYDANHILDVALPRGVTPEQAVAQVDRHFAGCGTRCYHWMMNPSAPDDQVEPMVQHLLSLGYVIEAPDVMVLRHVPQTPIAEVAGLTIIPARASYRHTEALLAERERWRESAVAEQLARAGMMHLDDPHYEALLALKDGAPVAYVGVLSVGELGRIEPLWVAEQHRGQGIGRTMMNRALEICTRSLFKHVFVSVERDNVPAQALYRSLGFEYIAALTFYQAPGLAD